MFLDEITGTEKVNRERKKSFQGFVIWFFCYKKKLKYTFAYFVGKIRPQHLYYQTCNRLNIQLFLYRKQPNICLCHLRYFSPLD